jgi:hypothetical protein
MISLPSVTTYGGFSVRLVWMAFLLTIPLLPISSGPVDAGFEEGVAAYERENYAAALREFLPVARNGDGIAQSYVGVIYQYGLGIPADLGKGC